MYYIDKKDRLILLASAFLAFLSAYMLLRPDPVSIELRKSLRPIAEVKSYDHIVKKKTSQSLAWNNIQTEGQLFQGDQVFTHANSSAEILYQDSTSLKLQSNTLLKIEESSDGINIDLKKGFLSLNFKGKAKKVKLQVGKKKLLISSKKASIKISNINNKSQIKIEEGEAEISQIIKEETLKPSTIIHGDIIDINNSLESPLQKRVEPEIVKKELSSQSPSSGQVFPFLTQEVLLKWKQKNIDPKDFSLTVSKNKNLSSPLFLEESIKKEEFLLETLSPGKYYWQVESKQESLKTAISFFIVEAPIIGRAPIVKPRQILKFIKLKDNIETYSLEWEIDPKAKNYYIEIYRKSDLTEPLLKSSVPINKIIWTGNRSGIYYFRVKAHYGSNIKTKWSKVGKLIAPISPFD